MSNHFTNALNKALGVPESAEDKKICSQCKEAKELGEFGKRNNSKDNLTGQCKKCLNIKHQKHCDENREIVREQSRDWANRNNERNYMTTKEWRKQNPFAVALQHSRCAAKKGGYMPCTATIEELKAAFNGRCMICEVPEIELHKRLNLDHSHETGEFRGWLCGNCNKMLGFAKDSSGVLINALHYLMQFELT